MKNRAIYAVLLLAVIVAILAGYFASSHPDGLEKVAGNLKIEHRASPTPGVFSNYAISFITDRSFSTIIAGIFGIIIIYFIFRSIANSRHIGELIKKLFNLP